MDFWFKCGGRGGGCRMKLMGACRWSWSCRKWNVGNCASEIVCLFVCLFAKVMEDVVDVEDVTGRLVRRLVQRTLQPDCMADCGGCR